MANDIRLTAEMRTEQGSVAVGRLRRAGLVPSAVGRLGGGTMLVQLNAHEFTQMLRHHHADQLLVTLVLDGQDLPAIMREVQFDVMTSAPIHADFGEVSLTERLRVECLVRVEGEPEGVRVGNGVLEQTLRAIHVECLPGDIVECFTIDVSKLGVGQSIAVRDLDFGDKYRITTQKDVIVATVLAPDAEAVAAAAAEDAAAAAAKAAAPAKGKAAAKAAAAPAAKGAKK